ncbi:peptidoglycan-binding domain-containing protein [Limimaricola litoreus]|uniref:Peptidoglycan-binding protein n=1 Tax=Limimaricola litoreus TaxID=2955316 RepID=A0A9X2JPI2_9RHOB|nr:peptidoglycan-binding domain-containing protein [Limimaricola litoreus]MCP1168854.1 peptidoglycan-binding protein [Limimaricola litoreus]
MEVDRAETVEIQILLQHLGYEVGAIDGVAGPLLSGAIRAFETDHGLPITGRADAALGEVLHGIVAAGPARALVATGALPRHGFWQRHSWPARMGGL